MKIVINQEKVIFGVIITLNATLKVTNKILSVEEYLIKNIPFLKDISSKKKKKKKKNPTSGKFN